MCNHIHCVSEYFSRKLTGTKVDLLLDPGFEDMSPRNASKYREYGLGSYVEAFESVRKEFCQVQNEFEELNREKNQLILLGYKVSREQKRTLQMEELETRTHQWGHDLERASKRRERLLDHCDDLHMISLKLQHVLEYDYDDV